ncbi:phage tail protein [Salmonella enterica]|nr:phage tail protein [Salmonella enterica]EHZ8203989.1 phage tail protein [Salmonella enterica]
METFRWKTEPGMTVESAPQVLTVRFGDGYSQRRPAGLNANLEKYSVRIRAPREDHHSLVGFLSRHGGVKAFLWTPPYNWRQIRVICPKWSVQVDMQWVTVTTVFEQVVI